MSTDNTISSIYSQYTASTSSSSSEKTESNDAMGKDAFLQLLVTQLNNQNPLEPQDNSEFVSQLAQFSSLEGMENLNSTLTGFYSSFQSSQALQASALVGRSVIVNTDTALVDTSKSFSGSIEMPASGNNLKVVITDAEGKAVKTLDLGTRSTGLVDFIWDGTDNSGNLLEPGSYKISATASIDGTTTALSTYLPATVNSVTVGQSGSEMMLNLAGLGSVALSQVQTIGQ